MSIDDDKDLIKRLGGPARLAKLLNFKEVGGTQRVANWQRRGIPPRVKLDFPDIFLSGEHQQPAA